MPSCYFSLEINLVGNSVLEALILQNWGQTFSVFLKQNINLIALAKHLKETSKNVEKFTDNIQIDTIPSLRMCVRK